MSNYSGVCYLTRLGGPDGERFRIDRADPYITIANDVVTDIAVGRCLPWAKLYARGDGDNLIQTVELRDAFGKKYIYRLDRYLPEECCWEASWPD